MLTELTLHNIKTVEVSPPEDYNNNRSGGNFQVVRIALIDGDGKSFTIKAFSDEGPIEVTQQAGK